MSTPDGKGAHAWPVTTKRPRPLALTRRVRTAITVLQLHRLASVVSLSGLFSRVHQLGGGMVPRPRPISIRAPNEPLPLPLVAGLGPHREEAVSKPELVSHQFCDVGRLELLILPLPMSRRGLRCSDAFFSDARDFRPEPEVEGCWPSRPAACAAQPLTAAA